MNPHSSFLSLSELKQPVNQWLCVAFLATLCFWAVLYFLTEQVQAVSESYVNARQEILK